MCSELDEQTQPLTLIPATIAIPRKAKPTNGVATANGDTEPVEQAVSGAKRKRDVDDAELETDNIRKRGKVAEELNGNGPITLDDEEGAIVLD